MSYQAYLFQRIIPIIVVIVAVIITFFTLRRVIDKVPKTTSVSGVQIKELFASLSDDELDVLPERLLENASKEDFYSNDLISERKAKRG